MLRLHIYMDMMLGSFRSSSSSSRSLDHFDNNTHHHHHHHRTDDVAAGLQCGRLSVPPATTQLRQLLLTCADLVSRSDLSAAHRLLSFLSAHASPLGDSAERLAHQFVRALSHRLHRHVTPPPPDPAALQSSYLCLNQVTPFLRFVHLTANQAILEAVDRGQRRAVHIVDFDVMHGVQWPPLMQALADRYPPPALRITGTGRDLETLRRTGDRLAKFAHSLGMRFQFHPVLVDDTDGDHEDPPLSSIVFLPDETLAVNCTLYLHRLLKSRDRLRLFLHRIKEMRPKVVTVAEREGSHNHPLFLKRFAEALDHYAAVFDSLEATLPPSSRERAAVEQVWFGGEITDIVAAEGERRRERHERFGWWEEAIRGSGFRNVGLSPFALSQAKLLLRLHYPSEGYQLRVTPDSSCFLLGWQNQPLFSVSSWH